MFNYKIGFYLLLVSHFMLLSIANYTIWNKDLKKIVEIPTPEPTVARVKIVSKTIHTEQIASVTNVLSDRLLLLQNGYDIKDITQQAKDVDIQIVTDFQVYFSNNVVKNYEIYEILLQN